MKGKVFNFHGSGGLNGRDGLFLGVKWLFYALAVGSYVRYCTTEGTTKTVKQAGARGAGGGSTAAKC